MGRSFKPVQFRGGEAALECNRTLLRCKRAHHREQQAGLIASVKTVSVGHNRENTGSWVFPGVSPPMLPFARPSLAQLHKGLDLHEGLDEEATHEIS